MSYKNLINFFILIINLFALDGNFDLFYIYLLSYFFPFLLFGKKNSEIKFKKTFREDMDILFYRLIAYLFFPIFPEKIMRKFFRINKRT